jgi:hypothetical protein
VLRDALRRGGRLKPASTADDSDDTNP